MQKCPTCGVTLETSVSGNMAQVLGWTDRWPCPNCDVGSPSAILATERGIAIEQQPVMVTIRPESGNGLEVMVGLGSISEPDPHPLVLSLDGTTALDACKVFVENAKESQVGVQTYIEREKAKLGIPSSDP